MSGALIALALALVMTPAGCRRRLQTLGLLVPARRRFPVLPCAAAVAAAVAIVLPVSVVAACSIVGVTLWMRSRRRARLRRLTVESEALQGALDVLVGELRVGAHPVAAFSVAASEVDGAVAASLRAVAARARLGADVAAGLRSVARSSSLSAHWERLAVCWQLAQDHGLAIATLMQTAQRDIVERGRFTAKVDAGMTGARTTAALLAGLPLLGVGLGQSIGADPVSFLLSGGMGGWLLVIGVALACGGLLWSDHITAQVST
jgi:tight adherence protein B